MEKVVVVSNDWHTFNQIVTVEHWNPVPGSSQVWLRADDGTRIVVARGEVERVSDHAVMG
jgi:hypothetical protein